MAPHPGIIDIDEIKGKARKDLLNLLEGVPGKKNLVIEQSLVGPSGLFVKFSTLQQYGVDQVFVLENENVGTNQRNVVFLVRSESAERAIAVTEQIRKLRDDSSIEHEFTVILTPRRNLVTSKIFEDAGLLGDVKLETFPLYFLPLDQDLLSLELNNTFADLFLRKDLTSIYTAAQALMQMQHAHGLFPRIIGKGDNAHRLMEILLKMRTEAAVNESASSTRPNFLPSTTIESLIIIDREVDFNTLLLTQLTYEGLIDELFNIKDNQAEVDISVVGPASGQQNAQPTTPTKGLKRKIMLDSSDKLYDQLRDSNFAIVGSLLNKSARRLQTDYESRHGDKTTAELREFVHKLPGYQAEQQSLKIHTSLAEDIMRYTRSETFSRSLEVQQNFAAGADPTAQHDTIEELIARDTPLPLILRLLCLESCTSNGLRQKDLEHFRMLILHAYGYQHVLTLDALEKMGLLTPRTSNVLPIPGVSSTGPQPSRTNYQYLRKALHLIVDEVNESAPDDIAYVYSGYAPLSVRLVQAVLQKQYLLSFAKSSKDGTNGGTTNGISTAAHGWQGFEDALKAAKGQTFNKVQKTDEAAVKARALLGGTNGKKTVVVMFVGGITRTEIAALRFIGNADPNRRILICTTGIVTGGRAMEAAMETRAFGS